MSKPRSSSGTGATRRWFVRAASYLPLSVSLSLVLLCLVAAAIAVGGDAAAPPVDTGLALHTDDIHAAITNSDAHPHLTHASATESAGRESARVSQHAVRLQAGTLNLDDRLLRRETTHLQSASSDDLRQLAREHRMRTAARSNDGLSRAPHRVFSAAFFHQTDASSRRDQLGFKPRTVAHTLDAMPPLRNDGTEPSKDVPLGLHVPDEETLRMMRTYFGYSGDGGDSDESVVREFIALYTDGKASNSAADTSVPSIDSPAHPLQAHPAFHYQWLVQLKSPVTPRALADVERIIAPYQLKHFLPHSAFLVSMPYATALKLQTGVTTAEFDGTDAEFDSQKGGNSAPTMRRGSVLFICMYHPTMKVQQGITGLLSARAESKAASLAEDVSRARRDFLAHAHDAPSRQLAHELRIVFTHPSIDATNELSDAVSGAFPRDRRDTRLVSSYASKQEKYWNNHPRFLDEMTRAMANAAEPTAAGSSLQGIEFKVVDSHQVVVRLPAALPVSDAADSFLSLLLSRLSSHHSVQYVESHSVFRVSNKHAKYVVQADLETGDRCTDTAGNADLVGIVGGEGFTSSLAASQSSTALFEAPFYSLLNLRGQDQLLTIGDTGVDYDSCFFYDDAVPTITTNTETLQSHRKIAAYFTSPTSDSRSAPRALPGDEEGHGTHTAGSLAGEVTWSGFPSASTVDEFTFRALANYSGIASSARLVIFDFQNPGDSSLYVPSDVYHDYLEVSHRVGSRVGSNSWGDDSGIYDSYTRDVDSFLYDHPDYVMVMAAGNMGARGLHTVATPAVAKNLVTIGSSLNGVCSFFDQGRATGIVISAPSDLAGNYSVTPASFGPSYITSPARHGVGACYAQPSNACDEVLSNAAECAGKVVFVERGNCTFSFKAHVVEAAGGVLMAYLHNEATPNYIIDGDGKYKIGIPSVTVAQSLADRIRPKAIDSNTIGTFSFNLPTYLPSLTQSEHALSDFSAKGPTLDGRIKPDILAPGEMIESVLSDHSLTTHQCASAQLAAVEGEPRTFDKDKVIASMMGTSMAAPIAAGVATLVRQYFTGGHYINPATGSVRTILPSAALVKAVLVSGTSPVGGTTPISGHPRTAVEPPPSYHQGFGRVELTESLAYDVDPSLAATGRRERSRFQLFVDDGAFIGGGEVRRYCFRVTDASVPFKATLAWTDPPPTLPTSIFLVNNLDLMIVAFNVTHTDAVNASHKVYIGNQRLHASTPMQLLFDTNNNVEKAVAETPTADRIYAVVVRGTSVPVVATGSNGRSGQQYALVVNGRFTVEDDAACPAEVYCPSDCSGHGVCIANASLANAGVCQCEPHWAGSDCSLAARSLVDDDTTTSVTLTVDVTPDAWSFFYYDVRPTDSALDFTLERTSSGKGDPDFYWTVPNMPARSDGAATLSYPTLGYHKYANTECDSCGHTTHTQNIATADLIAPPSTTPAGTVMMGIFGYCCEKATVKITLGITRR